MELQDYLELAVKSNASDIYIGAGRKVFFKINNLFSSPHDEVLNTAKTEELVSGLYKMSDRSMEHYRQTGDDDFSIHIEGTARFRVSACRQRGTPVAVIRAVPFGIPDYTELQIPDEVMGVANEKCGLVLVTGSAGSGKTTTLACILDSINKTRN